ncbi:hypothetical protein GGTG_09859, partial [Gaeumannomyces tritici R3-111a-1]
PPTAQAPRIFASQGVPGQTGRLGTHHTGAKEDLRLVPPDAPGRRLLLAEGVKCGARGYSDVRIIQSREHEWAGGRRHDMRPTMTDCYIHIRLSELKTAFMMSARCGNP